MIQDVTYFVHKGCVRVIIVVVITVIVRLFGNSLMLGENVLLLLTPSVFRRAIPVAVVVILGATARIMETWHILLTVFERQSRLCCVFLKVTAQSNIHRTRMLDFRNRPVRNRLTHPRQGVNNSVPFNLV